MPPYPPTIFLIPGAFAPPSSLAPLTAALHRAGLPTHTAPLPSFNPPDPRTASVAADVASVRAALAPLVAHGSNVLVVAHSYGGLVAGGAAAGLTTARGTGVVGLVFLAAMMAHEGQSLAQMFGGAMPPVVQTDVPGPGWCTHAVKGARHARGAFETAAPRGAWMQEELRGRLVYIRTMREEEGGVGQAELQAAVVRGSGAEWVVEDVDAPHEAYRTHAEEVARIVERYAVLWGA